MVLKTLELIFYDPAQLTLHEFISSKTSFYLVGTSKPQIKTVKRRPSKNVFHQTRKTRRYCNEPDYHSLPVRYIHEINTSFEGRQMAFHNKSKLNELNTSDWFENTGTTRVFHVGMLGG